MSEHTPEPWKAYETDDSDGYGDLDVAPYRIAEGGGDGFILASVLTDGPPGEANARRIVACVNACQGIPTETLEAFSEKGMGEDALKAVSEAEERLAEAERLLKEFDDLCDHGSPVDLMSLIGALAKKVRAFLEGK